MSARATLHPKKNPAELRFLKRMPKNSLNECHCISHGLSGCGCLPESGARMPSPYAALGRLQDSWPGAASGRRTAPLS